MRGAQYFIKRIMGHNYVVHSTNYKLPTYQHDQCERSLGAHLFTMEKRDISLVLLLVVLIGVFCFMVSSLAPEPRVVDKMSLLLPKEQRNSNNSFSHHRDSLRREAEQANWQQGQVPSLDGAPVDSNQAGNNIDLSLEEKDEPEESATGREASEADWVREIGRHRPRADESIEAHMITGSAVNSLNRELHLATRANFSFLVRVSGGEGGDDDNRAEDIRREISVGFRIEWRLTPSSIDPQPVVGGSGGESSGGSDEVGNKLRQQMTTGEHDDYVDIGRIESGGLQLTQQAALDTERGCGEVVLNREQLHRLEYPVTGNDDIPTVVPKCISSGDFRPQVAMVRGMRVEFDCNFAAGLSSSHQEQDLTHADSKTAKGNSSRNNNNKGNTFARVKCQAPELEARFRIDHLSKIRYRLLVNISDISSVRKTTHNDRRPIVGGWLNAEQVGIAVTLSSTNPTYTFMTISVRLFFALVSLVLGCCFLLCLNEYEYNFWSLEQKWTAFMFVLLVGANKPLYTLEFLVSSSSSPSPLAFSRLPAVNYSVTAATTTPNKPLWPPVACARNRTDLVDSLLDLNFVCGLLLCWLCFAHSIRQMSRPLLQFYGPKVAIVGFIWLIGFSAILEDYNICDANGLRTGQTPKRALRLDWALYLALAVYFLNLLHHFALSAHELRPMSYFFIRFRLQLALCILVLINYVTIVFRMSPLHKSIMGPWDPLEVEATRGPRGQWTTTTAASQLAATAALNRLIKNWPADPAHSSAHHLSSFVEMVPESGGNNFLNGTNASPNEVASSWAVLALMPQSYSFDSACSFLCYMLTNNIYVLLCAYFYWPVIRRNPMECNPMHNCRF